MKPSLLVFAFVITSFIARSQNKDLPSPVSDLQTLTLGSYIIPMDNSLQTDGNIGAGNFNLNSYGLIVHLLYNNIKVKWVIKAGKAKDGIDLTGTAEVIKPSLSAAASRNFIAGPFVIFAADTTGVAALVDGFYSSNSLTGNNRPRVFRLTANVLNVDIRYDLSGFKPKAAILTDGGNQSIHVNYMTAAKIPVSAYATATGSDLLYKCFTFATEPHNNKTGAAVDATIVAIRRFVEYGGNFLAQCAAVENYENNSLGRFQTTSGITVSNTSLGTSLSYPNPDLSFSQFQGSFNASMNGSVKAWSNSSATNDRHNHAGGTGGNSSLVAASVSKLKTGNGGMVFYISNHEFKVNDGAAAINGIRMFMNAFLTPASINNNCSTGQVLAAPLPVKLTAFNAMLNNDQSKTNLSWTTAQEINASHFDIERSTDGITFTQVGVVFAFGNTNETKNYHFSENVAALNVRAIYYRLKQVDADGKSEYSSTRIVRLSKQTTNTLSIAAYPNPVTNELRITIPNNWQGKKVTYDVIGSNGMSVKKIETGNSSQTETINVSSLARGFYMVTVTCNGETAQQKIVK